MINEEVRVVPWSELSSQSIFDSETILTSFEEAGLWQPVWSENLESISVLAGLCHLSFRELYDNRLHRDDFSDFSVVVLHVVFVVY